MKSGQLSASMLAVLLALPLLGASARSATIEVIETFDYPGTGVLTRPQKISDRGVIVGVFADSSGASRGFYRSRNGTFSGPVIEPNDTANFTEGRGINNARTICGDYTGSDGFFHGFFLSHTVFTEFDIAGASNTEILGINNAGDFAGNFIDSGGTSLGFVSLGGVITQFSVPGAVTTLGYQVNLSNEITGYYTDGAAVRHGFIRYGDGSFAFPLDPAGSTDTILFGNNDANWVVGRYTDGSGTHGLFFITPGDYVTFDYPGSTFTSLNGINRQGFICGRYIDGAGIEHGFLARVNPNETDPTGGRRSARSAIAPADRAQPSGQIQGPAF